MSATIFKSQRGIYMLRRSLIKNAGLALAAFFGLKNLTTVAAVEKSETIKIGWMIQTKYHVHPIFMEIGCIYHPDEDYFGNIPGWKEAVSAQEMVELFLLKQNKDAIVYPVYVSTNEKRKFLEEKPPEILSNLPPVINVDWGTPPVVRCVVRIACPGHAIMDNGWYVINTTGPFKDFS